MSPTPELDIPATSADAALAELRKRNYDDAAARKYAKAAKSWMKKGSPEWNVWLEVERRTGTP